jgi:hypothetical protein
LQEVACDGGRLPESARPATVLALALRGVPLEMPAGRWAVRAGCGPPSRCFSPCDMQNTPIAAPASSRIGEPDIPRAQGLLCGGEPQRTVPVPLHGTAEQLAVRDQPHSALFWRVCDR